MDSPAIRGTLFPVSTSSPTTTSRAAAAGPTKMLEHIVSRVRRHFRRTYVPQPQPPDLRRWSDFDEPFPPVSPGGYRRYYDSHRPPAAPAPSPSAPASTSLSTAATTISTATISSPFKRPPRNPARAGLTVIIEGTEPARSRTHSSANARTPSTPGVSPTASLRRRRRRLLRTPSVERAFPTGTGPCVSRAASGAASTVSTTTIKTITATATLDVSVRPFEGEFGAGVGVGEGDKGDTRSSYWSARSRFSAADPEGAALVG